MPEALTSTNPVLALEKSPPPWIAAVQKYLASAAWRFGGAGLGALSAILAARWLGRENLGISGVVQSVMLAAVVLITLGQDISLIRTYRSETDRDRRNELVNDMFWGRLFTGLALGFVLIGAGLLLPMGSKFFIATAGGFLLLLVQGTTPGWIFQANDDAPAQQRFFALQSALMIFMTVSLLRPLPLAGMDILVQALGAAIAWIFMWRHACRKHSLRAPSFARWQNYFSRAARHRSLILSALVIYCYVNLQQLLIASLCSLSELGLYRPALQVVQGIYPFLTLIPAILYPRLIDWAREGPQVLFRRQLQLMAFFSLGILPAAAFAFLVFPRIFPVVFGPEFAGGALPCVFLLTSKGFVVLNSLFTWGLWAQERDKAMLGVTSAVAVLSFALNWMLIPRFGALGASSVACLSEICVLGGSMFLSWRHGRQSSFA